MGWWLLLCPTAVPRPHGIQASEDGLSYILKVLASMTSIPPGGFISKSMSIEEDGGRGS
jgi:hypothetical protein